MLWLNLSKSYLLRLLLIVAGSVTAVFVYSAINTEADTGPYYFCDTSEQKVAFSFELAWEEGYLEEIIGILEAEEIAASFFMSSSWLSRNPDSAKSILVKGHEIGKHSFSTIPFIELSEEEISLEFKNFNELTTGILEYRSRLFRPPYGDINTYVVDAAKKHGYRTVLWSVDSNDYMADNSDEIFEQVTSRLHYGGIINFRISSEYLPGALPMIISYLRENGYEIVSISKLIDQ